MAEWVVFDTNIWISGLLSNSSPNSLSLKTSSKKNDLSDADRGGITEALTK